jgi:hypothetical protein
MLSLIKIDTEGAEYEMLKALDPEMRQVAFHTQRL